MTLRTTQEQEIKTGSTRWHYVEKLEEAIDLSWDRLQNELM
jgi:hypothetical protein